MKSLKKGLLTGVSTLALCASMLCANTAYAQEVASDGTLLTEESESVDTYYPKSRGSYLAAANGRVAAGYSSGQVAAGGTTTATMTVNTIRMKIYLDYYRNGSWSNIDGVLYTNSNEYSLMRSSTYSNVPTGYYYRVRGSHSVTKGSVTETCTTETDGIMIR